MSLRRTAALAAAVAATATAGALALHHDGSSFAAPSSPSSRAPGGTPGAGTPTASARPSATTSPAAPTTSASPAALPTGVRSVVALGDSVPAGSGSDAVPFPELVRRTLAPTNPGVTLTNLGTDGATAADLADALTKDAATRAAVRTGDVVLVTTGANDLYSALQARGNGGCDAACSAKAVSAAAASLSTALREIDALDTRPGRRVLVTSYWNVFQDGDVARASEDADTLAWSDTLTRQANTALCAAATAAGATCVDTYAAFKGDGSKDPTALLADDGDHPNQAGHALIAKALLAALERG